MNEAEKCRIRLAHWKDHNVDHVKGYEEVARTLEQLGIPDAANMIRRGISLVEAANQEFEKALQALASASSAGESTAQAGTGATHTHAHAHEHSHEHDHDHDHHHDHDHPHEHGHCHEHEHCGKHHHPHSVSAPPSSQDKGHSE